MGSLRLRAIARAVTSSLAATLVLNAAWGCFAKAAETQPSSLPAPVVRPLQFGTGAKADVRLGVAAATVAELTDAPPLLAEPGSQAFVGETFSRLAEALPDAALRRRFNALRARFRVAPERFDRATVSDFQSAVVALLQALPAPRDKRFLFGNVAEQAAYNARVLRETAADTELRAAVGKLDAADGTATGLAPLRAQLAALDSNRWSDSARIAAEIVHAVLGSSATVPFTSAPRIWTILVRTRRVPGRDAAHLSIAVVWFDGHHDTFAAYPEGDAFDRNAEHMTCRRNREPAGDALHATPLVPPRGSSYDALATAFARACDAFTAKAPEYRVSDISDDRFIAAMLTYAGLDPHVVRGR